MGPVLVDTDVLIDHLRGRTQAREFLVRRLTAGGELLCSTVTRAEIFAGLLPEEESQVRTLLSILRSIPVDDAIAEMAGAYRRSYGKSHGVLLPDALIAGTARKCTATLVSTNLRHYPMDDIQKLRPY